jgi:hypothetical protein
VMSSFFTSFRGHGAPSINCIGLKLTYWSNPFLILSNKSHKEIAELLDITTKGVEFHISKATRTLRLALKDYLPVSLLFFYLH